MYEIIYSPVVQEKLAVLKNRLTELCGEKAGIKRFLAVIDGFEVRLTFSNTGIPVKTIYDVEAEFEKYFIIYSHKNYFLYYIEDNVVYVMELYDEREDFAGILFGIISTTQETLDYWDE
ncbi:MAG: hypothetical protein K2N90_06425 [Lachnospiraceae bacterium]|nr:hypothetical protein [Lachnospiraceae bacterium]